LQTASICRDSRAEVPLPLFCTEIVCFQQLSPVILYGDPLFCWIYVQSTEGMAIGHAFFI
jgi:hypothetical protein